MTDSPNPKRITFDWTINVSHLIGVLGLVLTLSAGGMSLMNSISGMNVRVAAIEQQIASISRLMESSIRADTQIEELKRRLTFIEQKVD